MTARKKPGVAFWATVVVVLVLMYSLSFGPACWITSRTNVGASAIPVVYRPLTRALSPPMSPTTAMNRVSRWYAKIGAPEDWGWVPGPDWDFNGSEAPVGWMWVSTGFKPSWFVPQP